MRNALSIAVCFLLFQGFSDAQKLTSWEEHFFQRGDGTLLGMPGLTAPVPISAAVPPGLRRQVGRLNDVVDILVKIDKSGRVRPVRVLRSIDSHKGGADDRAKELVKTWTFAPGMKKGKAVDVAAILSVPFNSTHGWPEPAEVRMPADFAPGVPTQDAAGIIPAYSRLSTVPTYGSPKAMQAHIDGNVLVAFVINADGTVGETRVIQSIDPHYGLDALTVLAVKSFLFEPALKDGHPTATKAILEASFVLK